MNRLSPSRARFEAGSAAWAEVRMARTCWKSWSSGVTTRGVAAEANSRQMPKAIRASAAPIQARIARAASSSTMTLIQLRCP